MANTFDTDFRECINAEFREGVHPDTGMPIRYVKYEKPEVPTRTAKDILQETYDIQNEALSILNAIADALFRIPKDDMKLEQNPDRSIIETLLGENEKAKDILKLAESIRKGLW